LYTAVSLPSWLRLLLIVLVGARVTAAIWAAIRNTRGDYYAAMPGAYVKDVNPTLWDSPDLKGAWGYHLETYFHGPTQYLTLYPVAYLDSYAQIAAVLLPIYVVVLGVMFWATTRVAVRLSATQAMVPLLASTFLFFPLLQAFIQREFEVVATLAMVLALWGLLVDRRRTAGALLGYVAFFKYVPLLFVGYFGLRRWLGAFLAFVAASAIILGVSELLFGVSLFFNNNVPGHASQVFNVLQSGFAVTPTGHRHGVGFCEGWFATETTLANVRHGLCTVASHAEWFPPHLVYLAICTAVAAAYLTTHWRLDRLRLTGDQEAWRRALEFSIVTTVCACFFFAHYYYLIVLVIPFNVLLMRRLADRDWRALPAWGLAYFCVSAFVVPTGILSRLTGVDFWALFINGAWFLLGELLLMALLLQEYRRLAARSERKDRPRDPGPDQERE
jgi:hypothetical protein